MHTKFSNSVNRSNLPSEIHIFQFSFACVKSSTHTFHTREYTFAHGHFSCLKMPTIHEYYDVENGGGSGNWGYHSRQKYIYSL